MKKTCIREALVPCVKAGPKTGTWLRFTGSKAGVEKQAESGNRKKITMALAEHSNTLWGETYVQYILG